MFPARSFLRTIQKKSIFPEMKISQNDGRDSFASQMFPARSFLRTTPKKINIPRNDNQSKRRAGFIRFANVPCKVVLRTTKTNISLYLKKKASFLFEARSCLTVFVVHSYLGRESNPHAVKHWILNPACLPIPPPRHVDGKNNKF